MRDGIQGSATGIWVGVVWALWGTLALADQPTAPELSAMVEAQWRQEDRLGEASTGYAAATARHMAGAERLLTDLRTGGDAEFLAAEARQLGGYKKAAAGPDGDRESLYLAVRRLKRRVALANPLMKFDQLFLAKRVPTNYSHLVMQYFGWRARPGGGLCVLSRPGYSLECRDILAGRLAGGNVVEPRLSWDARRVIFSWVECKPQKGVPQKTNETGDAENYYHIYEVGVDGSGFRQLTEGPYDDLMPQYLPDGGVVFCSTRRRGYARCFGAQFGYRWHTYTLHRMDGDGRNLHTISFNDVNEWFPTVGHDGRVYYARWDYIDRDAVTHQNLWATRPDGTNPVTIWGNADPSPHCTFQAQPIPGTSKFVFTAAPHHSITGGSIAIVDPAGGSSGLHLLKRITPEIVFPEAERDAKTGVWGKGAWVQQYYGSPWPLSEKYFLVAYSPSPLLSEPQANRPAALGIYLLDAFGNRELIYRDPKIGCETPIPLVARPVPPSLPSQLPDDPPPTGDVVLTDIYQGLGPVPRGTIKALRIVQIFPKGTVVANSPPIGLAGEENARAILGTVPVLPDGSAHFLLPAGKAVLFQALDENGYAYQTMRTLTYVQPGERVSCGGCHEPRESVAIRAMSLKRLPPATPIDPGPLGGRPFSYAGMVQPILDRHCASCHAGKPGDALPELTSAPDKKHTTFSRSYVALLTAKDLVPRYAARNQVQVTPPGGRIGARGSRLLKLVTEGHHDVKLSDQERRTLAAWIDCNAVFYGVYRPEDQRRQLQGEVVAMPDLQ